MAQYHGDITHSSEIKFQGGQTEKSLGLAYILWFFAGVLGAHRFYMGRFATGAYQLGIFIVGLSTLSIFPLFAMITLGLLLVWVTVDAVLLWFMK